MAAPIMVAPASLCRAPVAATPPALKIVQACQNLGQAGLGDLVEVHAGYAQEALRSIEEPISLLLNRWQDLYWPMLKILKPKVDSGAVIVANDLDTFSEINIPYLCHPAVRKEGV